MQIMSFTDQFHNFHLALLMHSLSKITWAALNYYLWFTVLLSLSNPSSDLSQIWNYISSCPSLIKWSAFLTKAVLMVLTLQKIVLCLCMYVLRYICVWINFVDFTWERVIYYEKRFEMRTCSLFLRQSLIILRWPCAVDRTLKSNY